MPAVWVPAYAVPGCLGSNRTTHAFSTEGITEVQVAPESVLRRIPRPWVAASSTDGCAGETAIDQTGRSALPGCCAPVGVQRVSAADADAIVMSNPAASVMGVSRTRWRDLTWVPEKRAKDSRGSASTPRTLHAACRSWLNLKEARLQFSRATALASAAQRPAVAFGA